MNETVIKEAMQIRGVRGAALVGAAGKITASNIEAGELNDFFELLYRVASPIERGTALAPVRRIVVRTDKTDVLALLVHDKEALGVVSEKWRPLAELCADVKELVGRV